MLGIVSHFFIVMFRGVGEGVHSIKKNRKKKKSDRQCQALDQVCHFISEALFPGC